MNAKRFHFARRRLRADRDERGSSILEMALSLLMVVTVIFGTIELSSLMYTYTVLADAANEGLRYLVVNSGDQTGAITKAKTYASYSMHDTSAINVTVACAGTGGSCSPPNLATVTVSYSYVPYLGTFMSSPPTFNVVAKGETIN
jgi:Flp pilus assembly protein TadG